MEQWQVHIGCIFRFEWKCCNLLFIPRIQQILNVLPENRNVLRQRSIASNYNWYIIDYDDENDVTEYRIVYGTGVLYKYTRLILGLDSISLNVRRT